VRANFETAEAANAARRPCCPGQHHAGLENGKLIWDPAFYDDPSRHPNAAGVTSGQNGATNTLTLRPGIGLNGVIAQGQIFDQIAIIFSQPNARAPETPRFAPRCRASTSDDDGHAVRNNLHHPRQPRHHQHVSGHGREPGRHVGVHDDAQHSADAARLWQALKSRDHVHPTGPEGAGFTDYRYSISDTRCWIRPSASRSFPHLRYRARAARVEGPVAWSRL